MYYTVEMALDRGVTSPPQSCTELTRQRSLFVLFLILFYSKKGNNTERQQRINNIEKMSRKTRESQSSSIRPLEDISSCCLNEQTVSFVSLSFLSLAPCGFTTVFTSLQFWHEGSGAVNMQDKEWLTQLPTRLITSSWTPLPAPPSPDSKLYMEQNKKQTKKTKQSKTKNTSYNSTNLYAYFTIYFYYHFFFFNKYKATLWFKRKTMSTQKTRKRIRH